MCYCCDPGKGRYHIEVLCATAVILVKEGTTLKFYVLPVVMLVKEVTTLKCYVLPVVMLVKEGTTLKCYVLLL